MGSWCVRWWAMVVMGSMHIGNSTSLSLRSALVCQLFSTIDEAGVHTGRGEKNPPDLRRSQNAAATRTRVNRLTRFGTCVWRGLIDERFPSGVASLYCQAGYALKSASADGEQCFVRDGRRRRQRVSSPSLRACEIEAGGREFRVPPRPAATLSPCNCSIVTACLCANPSRLRTCRSAPGAVYDVLEALEESGRIRRGYFVAGLGATQFALPSAVGLSASASCAPRPTLKSLNLCNWLRPNSPANPYGSVLPVA